MGDMIFQLKPDQPFRLLINEEWICDDEIHAEYFSHPIPTES